MTLQRYRINNCADIKDDNGGYCLSEDVAGLEKSKWISVDDKLPERNCVVMVFLDVEPGLCQVGFASYDNGMFRRVQFFHHKLDHRKVTHWQLLPPPPLDTKL